MPPKSKPFWANDPILKKEIAIANRRGYHSTKIKKNKLPNNYNKRKTVYKRDEYECLKCGEKNIDKLTLDHIIPLCKGGNNSINNLQTLCEKCNGWKGRKTIDYRKKIIISSLVPVAVVD